MPVISDRLVDGAKLGRGAEIVFYARGLRDSVDGDAILTQARTPVSVDPTDGSFTTPNLEPGPYWCGIKWANFKDFENFKIVIGDTDTRLWPLLEEALPYTPAQESLFKQYRDEVAEFVTTAEGLSTAQDEAVADLVLNDSATKAALSGTYAPADVAEGLVSEDTYRFVGLPTFFHDFVGMTAGATAPTVSDSGDEVYWDSAAPYFTGNDFTTFNPGAATYFCTEDLGAKVTHVGARFKYAPNGGGNGGLACVAITDRRWTVANIANTNMGVHFWCTPTSWALTVWVAGVGQVGVLDGTYKDGMRLTADGTTEYMMQVWVAGNKATIILPDGVRRVAIDERFTSLAGNFAFFESMPNAANDDLACISTVRAGIGKTRAPWPV